AIAQSSRPKRKPLPPRLLFDGDKILFLAHFLKSYNLYLARRLSTLRMRFVDIFLATSLREILLALYITPTLKAPPIISLLSKVSNFANFFSKEKASALPPYYSS
ncbi:hypothetical protein L249_7424, partial [Ophiocordyceps polyrhachis-furcata BCC 54312]